MTFGPKFDGCSDDVYRQVELRRPIDLIARPDLVPNSGTENDPAAATEVEVVWIPAQFAHKGKHLDIVIDGKPTKGWKVTQTYSAMTRKNLANQETTQRTVEKVLDPHR